MTHAEWRVLPLASLLDPEVGRIVFVVLHVPLFALVLGGLTSRLPEHAAQLHFWVSSFLVVHAGLHLAFARHPANEFEGVLSNTLTFGAAVFGAVHLWGGRTRRRDGRATSLLRCVGRRGGPWARCGRMRWRS